MHCRLLVDPERLASGELSVTGDDYHYLVRVRRLGRGDPVTLFDGAGREADATIARVDAAGATLAVTAPRRQPAPERPTTWVLLPLIKGDRMELCVQKLTELGADRITPVRCARSVVKLAGERARARRERYRAVAREACRQCRRAQVPDIGEVVDLADAVTSVPGDAFKLALWERERSRPLAAALPETRPAAIALLSGPEGGLAPEEIDRAREAGFVTVGLGPRTLRAETAVIAAAAIVAYALGDL